MWRLPATLYILKIWIHVLIKSFEHLFLDMQQLSLNKHVDKMFRLKSVHESVISDMYEDVW